MTNEQLIGFAKNARKNAASDISRFKVGAALLTNTGDVLLGCNIEDPSGIGITNICAERCAIIKAISEGHKDFEKIAVVGGMANDGGESSDDSSDELVFCAPCGACRQYLNSWCPDIIVVLQGDDGIIKEYGMGDLLPYPFSK